ncbi:hypothetical protein SBA4_2730020 [Candidatus Sulfopaludibacter sp. SbA4]|nr:hypothetical protein SBA4_2730020 [Candidatus Sulfopaludibacter sp. SbA4]
MNTDNCPVFYPCSSVFIRVHPRSSAFIRGPFLLHLRVLAQIQTKAPHVGFAGAGKIASVSASSAEIAARIEHLTLAQIHAARAYYQRSAPVLRGEVSPRTI